MKRIIATFISVLTLAGCSTFQQVTSSVLPAEESNPPKELKAFQATAKVRTLWQVDTGSGAGKHYVRIHPYVEGDAVFVAGGTQASAWNKSTGQRLWQVSVDEEVTGGVNGGDGSVFVGTSNGSAVALDSKSGKIRWIEHLSSEVLAVSPASKGVVVFRTSDGRLHGLSTRSGEILWQKTRTNPILSLRGASTPIVVANMVIAGFDNGVITAFDIQSGTALWEITLSVPRGRSELDRMTDVDGKLKALGEALFAASYNGQIAGINMRDGEAAWAAPYSSYTGVDADPNGLYTTNVTGDLWKLEPQNGQPLWKMDDLQYRQPTAPTLFGKYVVVGDFEGYLHWINTSNGQLANRVQGDKQGYTVAPVLADNILYSLGKSGILSAFSLQ